MDASQGLGDRLLSTNEVLDLIGKSRDWLYRWRRTGRFPGPYQIGDRLAWKESDVMAWIEQQPRVKTRIPGGLTLEQSLAAK